MAVYTRNLRDITSGVPEVVASVLEYPASSFIFDGEALLFGPSGPEQFQDSMSRFGAEVSDQAPPLHAFLFRLPPSRRGRSNRPVAARAPWCINPHGARESLSSHRSSPMMQK